MQLNKSLKNFDVKIISLTQVVSDDGLVQALSFVQKLGDILWGALQQVVLNQELNALFGIHVEFLSSHGYLLVPLCRFALLH